MAEEEKAFFKQNSNKILMFLWQGKFFGEDII